MAIGGFHIGVRSAHADDEAAIRRLFPDVVVDDENVAADYSIQLERLEAGPLRPVATLRHGEQLVVRSRSNRRILTALAAYVSVDVGEGSGGMLLHATPLIRDGRAVLAPRALGARGAGTERILARAGVAVADGPAAIIAFDPPTVVVPGLHPAIDRAFLEALPDGGLATAGPGTYELAGVAVADFPFHPDVSTPARAVHAIVGVTRDFDRAGGQAGLEMAAAVVRQADVAVVDTEHVRAGLAATIELFGRGS